MEITANALQTVASGSNVVFTNTAVSGSTCIVHRQGSGLTTLRGLTNQSRARFRITFGGNIAVPSGGTVGETTLAFAINGEPVQTSTMASTPSAVSEFNNVARSMFVDVPKGCCMQVSIQNTSGITVEVANASFTVERVA